MPSDSSSSPRPSRRDHPGVPPALLAYVGPLILFALFLILTPAVRSPESPSLWLRAPEYWLYPLQAVVCLAALAFWWRHYRFDWAARPNALVLGALAGVVALGVWIAPGPLLGQPPRTTDGFDPTPLLARPALYWLVLLGRFLRLVVAVPLVEEIFWRGFLLRYLTPAGERDFVRAPYVFTPLSFGVVSVMFMLEHTRPDWPAALLVGALYNALAIRTQSLGACVLAHAVTNAGLGAYVLATRQWGYW